MRIIFNDTDFDLPKNFGCVLTRYNVLLTGAGEQTNPITLPASPKNLKLVGYGDRIDGYSKPLTDMAVVVSDGMFNRTCNLGIHGVDRSAGISATIYLGTGDFYSKVGNTRLSWLQWPTLASPGYAGQPLLDRVAYLIERLATTYSYPSHALPYSVAPVVSTQKYTWQYDREIKLNKFERKELEGLLVLNGFEKYQTVLVLDQHSDDVKRFEGEFAQKMKVDSSIVDISTGYGMTPFLKLRYVVDFIFSAWGFGFDTLPMNAIIDSYEDDIVLLNNVADAIYAGRLYYKQLLPDVTVKEFLGEVERLFAGKFLVDENTKTVTFISYESALNALPDLDLTGYCVATPALGTPEFTKIKIVDKLDTAAADEATEDKVSALDFSLLKQALVVDVFTAPDRATFTADLGLEMIAIDGIVHLNSTIEVVGVEKKEEKPSVSSLIQLASIKDEWKVARFMTENSRGDVVRYRTTKPVFAESGMTDLAFLESRYAAYKIFMQQSNIPIEIEMDIPEMILERMNYHTPKILMGQKVMIESIESVMGGKELQKVKLRTLRVFENR